MEDFLIGILSIHFLQMDLYNPYNLPVLYPELNVHLSYMLEGEYLAISVSGTYVAIPTTHQIYICLATEGHLCVLNTAL